MSNVPSPLELDFKISQVINASVMNNTTLTRLSNELEQLASTLRRRRIYMKRLLLFKAETLFVEKTNDYIFMLCNIYKMNYSRSLPPEMEKDTTPPWLIADAVIAEPNEKDRNAYSSIFEYVYGYPPSSIFGNDI